MISLTTTSGGTIILPDPILGDSEQLDIKVKYEFSMTRVVHSSKKTDAHTIFNLAFQKLKPAKVTEFKTWLLASSGQTVTFVNYDTVSYSGLLLGDPFEFTQSGIDCNGDLHDITIQIEAATP